MGERKRETNVKEMRMREIERRQIKDIEKQV